jgi:protein gp37
VLGEGLESDEAKGESCDSSVARRCYNRSVRAVDAEETLVSERSAISWTQSSWNPVTGCTKVSAGCAHCYAQRFAERWRGVPGHPYQQGFDLKLWPDRLDLPLRWKAPRMIFVNSMSDLFHEAVPLSFIEEVFAAMATASRHTFQVLTKRSRRLADVADSLDWPSNVWMGVTVESEQYLERVCDLREVPAAVRFVSAEPLLGPLCGLQTENLDWVIVGGESGPERRSMHAEWALQLRDKCVDSGVPFYFKQWGSARPQPAPPALDGRVWRQMPRRASEPDGQIALAT